MDEIKFLLEKYYRGETTVAEEKRLADLLAVADMAALEPELQADARAFLALDAYAGAEIAAVAMRAECGIDARVAHDKRRRRFRMMAAAASVAVFIVAGAVLFFNPEEQGRANAYDFAALKAQLDAARERCPECTYIEVEDSTSAAAISGRVLGLLANKVEHSAGVVAYSEQVGKQTIYKTLNTLKR